jgi:hypothetical protein
MPDFCFTLTAKPELVESKDGNTDFVALTLLVNDEEIETSIVLVDDLL